MEITEQGWCRAGDTLLAALVVLVAGSGTFQPPRRPAGCLPTGRPGTPSTRHVASPGAARGRGVVVSDHLPGWVPGLEDPLPLPRGGRS